MDLRGKTKSELIEIVREKAEALRRLRDTKLDEWDEAKTRKVDKLIAELDQHRAELKLAELEEPINGPHYKPDPSDNYQGPYSFESVTQGRIQNMKDKTYRSLFGDKLSKDGWENAAQFFAAAQSGKYHPNLRVIKEGVGSEGGFLVPDEFSAAIHDAALESEIVLPRCQVEPMTSDTKKVPATEIGDHSQNLYGNLIAYWKAESATMTEKTPKFRQINLNAKKLTILMKYSSEWREDAPNSEANLERLAGAGLAWYRDKALLKGTGSGQPLGILNASCLITVSKETGQAVSTIQYENLTKMLGRLHPACFNRAIWICHLTTIPQLLGLSIPVGTAGSHYPVLTEAGGVWKILTRPVIFTEKTESLGSKGDVLLCDLSQYVAGLRKEMRFETSIGPGFTTDEVYARLISRLDGMPLWSEALTLADGTTTVGPFVTLQARS